MDISDNVVVFNEGAIEQAAPPRELYDRPANPFVRGFVGSVNRLGDGWVRPHDVHIAHAPNGTTKEAQVERIVHLGFEVRVELLLGDGQRAWAQLSRAQADELELREGGLVFVRADAEPAFAATA